MRTKYEQNPKFQAQRGVSAKALSRCLDHSSLADRAELDATYGTQWTASVLAEVWTNKQVDGLTILADGEVAACILCWQPLPGQWSCGMVTGAAWPGVGWSAARYLRRYLRPVLMGQKVRRISCIADGHHPLASRWLTFLGFQREGTLKAYGQDGRDFELFAMVPKHQSRND